MIRQQYDIYSRVSALLIIMSVPGNDPGLIWHMVNYVTKRFNKVAVSYQKCHGDYIMYY